MHPLLEGLDHLPKRVIIEDLQARDYATSPHYSSLHTIRAYLEREIPTFPYRMCAPTSRVIREVLGWPEQGGFYVPLLRMGAKLINAAHIWNQTPEGDWADLTADQEDKGIPPEVIMPKGAWVLRTWGPLTGFAAQRPIGDLSKEASIKAGTHIDLERIIKDLRERLKV